MGNPPPTNTTGGATPLSSLMADMELRPHPLPQLQQQQQQQQLTQPPVNPAPQPPPSAVQANLLDLFDDSPPSVEATPTSSFTSLLTQQSSLLDAAAPLQSQGTLALTLFETPVSSIRVPEEYASFPVLQDYENKVRVQCVEGVTDGHAQ